MLSRVRPGVVDENVDAADGLLDLGDERLDRCRVADVAGKAPSAAHGLGHVAGLGPIPPDDRDPRPAADERFRDRAADAASAAGDERDAPLHVDLHAARSALTW